MRKRKSAVGDGKIGNRDGTVRRLASDLRFNDYVDFEGKPCRVLDLYTTERGFCHFHAINILDGFFVRYIAHSSKQIVMADVSFELYQLIAISSKDNSVTLLHYGGDHVREDIKLPENEFLRSIIVFGIEDGKKVFVTIASALGKEAVYAVEVDQAGSAIDFKRNEDAVNQSKTNDSDVVVNQSKTKKSDVVVVNQNKTKNSDVAKKACLKEKATKALLSKKGDGCANLSAAKYGHKYAQRSYRDVVLGHNATGEEIY